MQRRAPAPPDRAVRQELGYAERVPPEEALARTVAWERANPSGQALGIGMVDYEAEDAILAEIRGGGGS